MHFAATNRVIGERKSQKSLADLCFKYNNNIPIGLQSYLLRRYLDAPGTHPSPTFCEGTLSPRDSRTIRHLQMPCFNMVEWGLNSDTLGGLAMGVPWPSLVLSARNPRRLIMMNPLSSEGQETGQVNEWPVMDPKRTELANLRKTGTLGTLDLGTLPFFVLMTGSPICCIWKVLSVATDRDASPSFAVN